MSDVPELKCVLCAHNVAAHLEAPEACPGDFPLLAVAVPAASLPARGFTPLSPESPVMADQPALVSPTGAPIVPTNVVKVVALLVAVAVGVEQAYPNTVAGHIAAVVVQLGAVFGIISQGARRPQP